MTMSQERAETIALQALGWLAGHDDLLPVFLGSTGASSDELRAQASDSTFQGAVLEFILMDDAWVAEFCDAVGLDYSDPMMARAQLPGGEAVHWT